MFQINIFNSDLKPMMVSNVLRSANLIGTACSAFVDNCVAGITANEDRISQLLNESLMLVTGMAYLFTGDAGFV